MVNPEFAMPPPEPAGAVLSEMVESVISAVAGWPLKIPPPPGEPTESLPNELP